MLYMLNLIHQYVMTNILVLIMTNILVLIMTYILVLIWELIWKLPNSLTRSSSMYTGRTSLQSANPRERQGKIGVQCVITVICFGQWCDTQVQY
jgi:hypothetical protein